jgi:hypothetical protein
MFAMTVAHADAVVVSRAGRRLTVSTATYSLLIEDTGARFSRSPYAILAGADGRTWTELNLLASVDTLQSPDEIWEVSSPVDSRESENVVLTVAMRGTAWNTHETRVVCSPESVSMSVRVTGAGSITDLWVLGGNASMPHGATGEYRSGIRFASVFVPAPGEPVQLVRPARSSAVLGVTGDADPGRLNAIFSPPPLVLGLGREPGTSATGVPGGDWLALSVRAPVNELTFTTMRYEPFDGGYRLRLSYDGHTVVAGEWTSPSIVFTPSDSGWGVLDAHRADLVRHGMAPDRGPEAAVWWREPIFCGWGAQCARVAALEAEVVETGDATVVLGAPSLARQDVYDEFLLTLEQNDLEPGTIVIDDRWQHKYGTAQPDPEHWPDLKAWIAARHARGQKVLLWWKAWDPDGIPVEECVVDAAGRPVSVDPANPAYRARLESIVEGLLGADGLDADGFKVDFTQRAPSGKTLRSAPGAWGIAALHHLLETLYRAAKAAKPDALVICHTMHPSFGDVLDMIRLNDVSKYDVDRNRVPVVDQLRFRNEIARRTLPHHLVDTDQWPMPSRSEWLAYATEQATLGVPALYYVEAIDRSGETIGSDDLAVIAGTWREYREGLA